MDRITHHYADLGDVRLRYVAAGEGFRVATDPGAAGWRSSSRCVAAPRTFAAPLDAGGTVRGLG
jgi:hypothetical protein